MVHIPQDIPRFGRFKPVLYPGLGDLSLSYTQVVGIPPYTQVAGIPPYTQVVGIPPCMLLSCTRVVYTPPCLYMGGTPPYVYTSGLLFYKDDRQVYSRHQRGFGPFLREGVSSTSE